MIIEEVNYLRSPDQLHLLRGAAKAISRLRRAGLKAIVVTNQSVVARGHLTLRGLEAIHRRLRRLLWAQGARLDAIYFCPHYPGAGRSKNCRCRKPKTGMLEAAARRFGLDLRSCYLIGDATTDIRTARNAGCRALLVRTGKGGRDGRYKTRPDRIFRDLGEAALWVLKAERAGG